MIVRTKFPDTYIPVLVGPTVALVVPKASVPLMKTWKYGVPEELLEPLSPGAAGITTLPIVCWTPVVLTCIFRVPPNPYNPLGSERFVVTTKLAAKPLLDMDIAAIAVTETSEVPET